MSAAAKFGIIAVSLILAIAIDYLAPWPYVMSPLYEIVTVLAVLLLSPYEVAAVAAICFAINLVSSLVQETPPLITAIYSGSLVITGCLAVLVSSQRKQIIKYSEDAEAARQQIQKFLGMVSHDIRNPTTALIGYIQLLQRQVRLGRVEQIGSALENLDEAAHRIQRLSVDLIDASAISTGHFILLPERVDLVPLLQEIIALRQATTDRHALALEAPEHLWGQWDPQRLAQVASNLISNAIKYSPEGGDVRVRARQLGETVELAVSDQGMGIDPAMQPRLFQLFAREARGQKIEGAGLGLAITKANVEDHGGRIWVESVLDHGSTFYVQLPLETPAPADVATVQRE